MTIENIRKHNRAIRKITDLVARQLEMRSRSLLISKSVTPEYAEKLMKHNDLVELLDQVWLTGMNKRLKKKRELSGPSLNAV